MTTTWAQPDEKTYDAIRAAWPEACLDDKKLADNYYYHGLYGLESGFYSAAKKPANLWWYEKKKLCRAKTRLSRREWIERFFFILKKDGQLGPLILNPAQRRFYAMILRIERKKLPVRIVILKARQIGFSTLIQAIDFHDSTRGTNLKSIIIANVDETAELLLSIAMTALTEMPKTEDKAWEFKMTSKSAYSLVWAKPIGSAIKITSAKRPAPGRGGMRRFAHVSETAFWENAQEKATGLINSIPNVPGTYIFNESTANGQGGFFHDEFWDSWHQRDVPLEQRTRIWEAMFFAWFEDPGYRISKTSMAAHGMSEARASEIARTLDEEERWCLEQTYYQRWTPQDEWALRPNGTPYRVGVGPRKVDLDQLAWRRMTIQGAECRGDVNLFSQEFPSRPEVAFLASGRPVFDTERLQTLWLQAKEPIWRGDLVQA